MDVVLEFKSIPENIQNEMIKLYGVQGLLEMVTFAGFTKWLAK